MSIIINPNKGDPRPEGPELKKQGKPISYQHQIILNQILSVIGNCPMDSRFKIVMRMDIWGVHPKIFRPLTHKQIATVLRFGVTKTENMSYSQVMAMLKSETKHTTKTETKDIKQWIKDGQWNVEQSLKKDGIVTITEKFLKDGNLKKIMEDRKRIIV